MDQQAADRHIYLFSSNVTGLYAIDALNAVCLPQDWIVHFRYEQPYVDPLLWQAAEQPPRADGRHPLRGRDAVISFVNQREKIRQADGKRAFEVRNVLPLRVGKIEHVTIDGSVIHFYFSLGTYVRYDAARPDEEAASREQLLTELLTDLSGTPARTPREGCFAALGRAPLTGLTTDDGDAVGAFQALVRVLSGRGFAPDATIFSQFLGLYELEHGKAPEQLTRVPIDRGILPLQSGFAVKDGRDYAFQVATFHTTTLNSTHFGDAAIEIAFDPDRFDELDRTRMPIRSRYDRFALPVAARRHNRNAWTAVTLRGVPGSEPGGLTEEERAEAPRFLAPEWIAPIRITVSWWLTHALPLVAEIFVAAGTATSAVLVARKADLGWILLAGAVTLLGIGGRTFLGARR